MSVALSIDWRGKRELERTLKNIAKRTEKPLPLYRGIGQAVVRETTLNMTKGIDADGRMIKKPQTWTRYIRRGIGTSGTRSVGKTNETPLVATGTLRRSISVTEISERGVRIGFSGNQAAVAEHATTGGPGDMPVKPEMIRTKKKGGGQYIRILLSGTKKSGKWMTKKVTGGTIHFKNVPPRPFFWLSSRMVQALEKFANDYLEKAVNGN